MSFTKTVFYVPSTTTDITETPPEKGAAGISVFENTGFQATAAALVAGDKFQIVNGFYSSPLLKKDDIVLSKTSVAAAGTAQQITVTVATEANNTAYVKLIDVTDGREKFSINTFEVNAADAGAAATALGTLIAAQDNVATAVATGAALVITFVKDVVYRAAANDASAVEYTTAGVHSVGQAAEVKAALAEGMAYQGVTNQGGSNIVSPDFGTAVESDKIVVEIATTVGDRTDRHEIVVYVAAGSTAAYTGLKTVFSIS